jgi:hypothetical protein
MREFGTQYGVDSLNFCFSLVFDLASGNEFVFVPAYGEIQKLTVC